MVGVGVKFGVAEWGESGMCSVQRNLVSAVGWSSSNSRYVVSWTFTHRVLSCLSSLNKSKNIGEYVLLFAPGGRVNGLSIDCKCQLGCWSMTPAILHLVFYIQASKVGTHCGSGF